MDVTPPAVPHSDGDESASSDVFVSDLIVTPASVLSESSKVIFHLLFLCLLYSTLMQNVCFLSY